jgi:hypothetical protein
VTVVPEIIASISFTDELLTMAFLTAAWPIVI